MEWFHAHSGLEVIWIEPTILRFPKLSDIRNLKTHFSRVESEKPAWIRLVEPINIPFEPLPFYDRLMVGIWNRFKKQNFSQDAHFAVVIGLPSKLALFTLTNLPSCTSLLDVMDDFPSFHKGLAAKSIRKVQTDIARRADHIVCSSPKLVEKFGSLGIETELVQNGSNGSPPTVKEVRERTNDNIKFCYLGTLGQWFDWEYLKKLARALPGSEFTIIGQVFSPPRSSLPNNIRLVGTLPHTAALAKIREFDVGLIPFKINELTKSVDAVKLYEYLDAGLVVLASRFGGMEPHLDVPTIVTYFPEEDVENTILELNKILSQPESEKAIQNAHTWANRFASSFSIEMILQSMHQVE